MGCAVTAKEGSHKWLAHLDAGLANADGLLLHGFVNGHLVANIHFVKLINAANAIVCQHERTSLDCKLVVLWLLKTATAPKSSRTSRRVIQMLEDMVYYGGMVSCMCSWLLKQRLRASLEWHMQVPEW
jgi:hypothetical protein